MSLKSTQSRYGTVAIAIHWVSALGVVGALTFGLLAANSTDPAAEPWLLGTHIVFGLSVFALTLLRILWWVFADKRPAPVSALPRWQHIASSAVHGLLYVIILLMASSGITTMILSGAGQALFAGTAIPDVEGIIPFVAHGFMARLMLVLLGAHIGAALYHQFVRRDHLLARMGLGPA